MLAIKIILNLKKEKGTTDGEKNLGRRDMNK